MLMYTVGQELKQATVQMASKLSHDLSDLKAESWNHLESYSLTYLIVDEGCKLRP